MSRYGYLPSLITIAALLSACSPSAELSISGEAELDVVRVDAREIRFKLKNRTAERIAFWGARDWWWEDAFPQAPQFECVLSRSGHTHQSPYPLIDGPAWERLVIEPGEQIGIVVGKSFLVGSDGKLPTGRCRFVLHMEGDAVLKSEEFESRP